MKSKVSRVLTAGKRAARIRRCTMRWRRSMSSSSASRSRYWGWSTPSAAALGSISRLDPEWQWGIRPSSHLPAQAAASVLTVGRAGVKHEKNQKKSTCRRHPVPQVFTYRFASFHWPFSEQLAVIVRLPSDLVNRSHWQTEPAPRSGVKYREKYELRIRPSPSAGTTVPSGFDMPD